MSTVRMRRRDREKTADDTTPPGDDAADLDSATVLAVDREIWLYARAVAGRMLAAALIAIIATVSVEVACATFEVEVTWVRFDADKGMAAFGIIGLIVTALQVAVRSTRRAQVDPADGARQQFLRTISFITMPVVLWLGFYMSWTDVPVTEVDTFDPVRAYGPIFFTIVLALVAADAAAARPFDSSSPVAIEARRKRQLIESRDALRVLSRQTKPPSRQQWALAGLIGIALLLTQVVSASLLAGSGTPAFTILVTTFFTLLLAGACKVATSITVDTARGRGASAAVPLAAASVVWLFLGAIFVSAALQISTVEDWQQSSAAALLLFLAVTGSDAVAVITFMGIRRGRRLPLREIATRLESRRLIRNRHTLRPRDLPSTQARMALLLSPFFPLGLLVAQPVFSVLRERPHPPTRRALRRVVVASVLSGGVAVAILVAVAVGVFSIS